MRKWGDDDINDAGLTEKGQEFWQIFKVSIIVLLAMGIPLFAIWGICLLAKII